MKKIALLTLVCLLSLSACSAQKILKGADADAVLAFSEPAVDNLMAGYNAEDYTVFARDFDTAMSAAIPASGFPDFFAAIHDKIGDYQSREVAAVVASGEYYTLIYTAVFENESPVTMRVSFHAAALNQISGLWFDSAKLREK